MDPGGKCPCEGQTLDRHFQATVLALLGHEPLHAYALVERLAESPLMKGVKPDPAGVYRLLGAMEKQGLVAAAWGESARGPARRMYELTAHGRRCLGKWIATLDDYQQSLARLVAVLRQAAQRH